MEQRIIFREMLSEIKALADSRQNRLTKAQVDEFFSNAHLTKEQLEMIYEYLEGQKIQVEGYGRSSFRQEEVLMKNTPGSDVKVESDRTKEEGKTASKKRSKSAQEEMELCSMELYLKEIDQIRKRNTAEELELFERAAKKDPEAKKSLVELYLPLVCELAGEYDGKDCLTEDLIQEGNMGLLMAVETLECRDSLAAYQVQLMNAVNQYMQDTLQEQKDIREMGEEIVQRVNHLNQALHNLEEELEHKVSIEELSAYLDMPVEEIMDILRMAGDEIEIGR